MTTNQNNKESPPIRPRSNYVAFLRNKADDELPPNFPNADGEPPPPYQKWSGSNSHLAEPAVPTLAEVPRLTRLTPRSGAQSAHGIRLIDHNARQQLTITPTPQLSDSQTSLNNSKHLRQRPRTAKASTMTDLMNCYTSPIRSNAEFAESVPSTPLPLNEWQRTLLHLAAERGVTMKIREFVENECGGAAVAKRFLEMAGDQANGDRPLHLAAKNGHLDAAKTLIEYGAQVDAPNRYADTPLILAVKGGYLNCVQLLIQSGALMPARGRYGQTAFHWACATGNLEILKLLLKNTEQTGEPIDVARALEAKDFTEDGNMPFHLAAMGNHVAIARCLATYEPNALVVESKNGTQYTALHLAARQGKLDMVRWLVDECHVEIETPGWLNKTPLHKAVENGHLAIIEFLLDRGADIEAVELQLGGSPLHTAAMHGQAEAVRYLLERGAEILRETSIFGFMPIHIAALYGKNSVIEELLKHPLKISIDVKGSLGRTPLMLACASGRLPTAEYLVKKGASLEERDEQLGGTALHFSCWFGNLPIIEFLLKSGAERSSRDQAGDTPLHWACLASQAKAVAFLLTRGAETGAKDDRIGRTALHDASSKGYTEIVRLLLSRADIQAVDGENGATALHLAAWFGRVEVMALLVAHRAKIEAEDHYQCTPLHWAVINNQLEAVQFLIDRGANINRKGGKYGRTPLHMAAEWGRREIAELLLDRGAQREAVDDRKLSRPLHLATQHQHPSVVQLFLERKANVFVPDDQGFTPLHLAVREGSAASLQDARKWREAELKAKTGLGVQSLEDAVASGRNQVTEELLRNKLLNQSPDQRLDETSRRQSDVINLLLDYNPNLIRLKTARYGRTVLHVAAQAGQLIATQTLMSRGADARERDKIGKTPLRLAFENSKYDIVRFFVKIGITE